MTRAIAILRALEERPDGMSLGEIATRVDLPRATVQRIVATLAHEHFVSGGEAAAGLRLGPALIALAAAARPTIIDRIRPLLVGLSRTVGETVDLSRYERGQALFLDQAIAPQRLRAVSAVGSAFELHCCANGKAMLAQLQPGDLRRLERRPLAPYTPRTVTEWLRLRRQLRDIRRTGIAFDREEQSAGICAVGTAFRDPAGGLYGISIPTPAPRFAGREAELAAALLQCRSDVIARLGCPATAPQDIGERAIPE